MNIIFKSCFTLLIVSSILEFAIYPSLDAIFCICLCFLGVWILKTFHLTVENLLYYPVSTVAIAMYVFFFLVLPMSATLLEKKPVIYNLHSPIETFSNIVLLESVLIASQKTYKNIFGKKNIIRKYLLKTPAYSMLTSSELWFLIIVSAILYIYVMMSMGLYSEEGENIGRKLPPVLYVLNLLLGGYHALIFLFLYRDLGIIKNGDYKIRYIPIILLAILLFFVGIATNMRTAAIQTISVAFFLFVYYWFYFVRRGFFNYKKVVLGAFVLWFFMVPFMNISRAMVEIRGQRNGLSGTELLELTFSNLSNQKIEKSVAKVKNDTYSEEYLSNDILQRFCSVKILDETLYRAHEVGYANPAMNEHLENTLESYIPGFLRSMLKIKETERDASLTDRLAYEANSAFLGGVKIGTLQGLGLALYGWFYIPIIFFLYIIIFYILDSTVYYEKGKMRFSWIFLSNVVAYCYWFSDRHYYVWEYRFLMRGFIEAVVFTCITLYIVKRIPFLKH